MANAIVKQGPTGLSDFEDFDLEELAGHAEKMKRAGSKFIKIEEGKTQLRFLPGRSGQKGIFPWYEHFYTNDKGQSINHVCPLKSANQRCAVCERETTIKAKAKTRVDQMKAREYEANGRFHSNVIDRADQEKGVQIYAFGIGVMNDLLKIAQDEAAGGKFWDPTNGFDIVVDREGKGKNDTKYKILPARSTTPVSKDPELVETWMEQRFDLTTLKEVPSYEDTVALLTGKDKSGSDVDF